MSVHELEAQIEKLSADIAGQKKILANLEKSKSLVQRQLNAVRDPVARLPLEISSEIFLRCLPPLSEPGAHHVPMLFLNICNIWTDIALSTPALWATIRIVLPRADGFAELLAKWVQRAGSHPLSVSLYNNFDDSEGVAPLIWQYGQQLKHLELCYGKEEDGYEFIDIDILGCSSPGPLPLLATLTLRCLIDLPGDSDLGYYAPQILELLRRAPNLVECIFDDVQTVHGVDDIEETLVLPDLRRLIFGHGADNPQSDDGILTCLTTPRLESLSVSILALSGYDLLSFLKRSSPPLRELVLGGALDSDDFEGLDECLRLVPTLARLELWWWPVTRRLDELFPASLPCLLPDLRSLTIRLYSPATEPLWWETLLRVLTVRRTQIQIVFIELVGPGEVSSSEIAANIIAGFKELVAGGMNLHIGNQAQNLLSR
ncbi:hypothetical protein B0H11DRAFT_2198011 [Mycena galericulata]|nr:hypothetical protein B0H11DRAFT_2198011 [Mycena galericulata]